MARGYGWHQRYLAYFCFVSRFRKFETEMASCQSSLPVSRREGEREREIDTKGRYTIGTGVWRKLRDKNGGVDRRRMQQDSNESFELAQFFMNKQFISYVCMAFCWIPTRALINACSSLFLFLCRFVHAFNGYSFFITVLILLISGNQQMIKCSPYIFFTSLHIHDHQEQSKNRKPH